MTQNPNSVSIISDETVVIRDLDAGSVTVTNAPQSVLNRLDALLPEGLGGRRVIYRDTTGRYDVIEYGAQGQFVKFAPGTNADHELVREICSGHQATRIKSSPIRSSTT